MFKTITAKYAGKCKKCGLGFEAGTRIRYGGTGRTYHLGDDCPARQTHDRREDSHYDDNGYDDGRDY